MGLVGGIGRTLLIPLILLNLIFAIIILGFAGHMVDKDISGKFSPANNNGAARPFIYLALVSAAVALASYLSGLHHLRLWRTDSGSAAQGTSWIAWLLLILAFCLAWKEIHIGHRPIKLRVLEAFVIMLTFLHFLYVLLTHLGHRGDTTQGTPHKPMNPNAPAAASAV